MIERHHGQVRHGAEAMMLLNALSADRGVLSRLLRLTFRRRWSARLVYPVLVTGRRITLRLLGRRPIGL